MNYRYFWKELSEDGLLKEPKEVGFHYDSVPMNGYEGGFKTEQEAVDHFIELHKKHEWSCPRELVLIKVYSIYRFD
jgi:hypothetical protein